MHTHHTHTQNDFQFHFLFLLSFSHRIWIAARERERENVNENLSSSNLAVVPFDLAALVRVCSLDDWLLACLLNVSVLDCYCSASSFELSLSLSLSLPMLMLFSFVCVVVWFVWICVNVLRPYFFAVVVVVIIVEENENIWYHRFSGCISVCVFRFVFFLLYLLVIILLLLLLNHPPDTGRYQCLPVFGISHAAALSPPPPPSSFYLFACIACYYWVNWFLMGCYGFSHPGSCRVVTWRDVCVCVHTGLKVCSMLVSFILFGIRCLLFSLLFLALALALSLSHVVSWYSPVTRIALLLLSSVLIVVIGIAITAAVANTTIVIITMIISSFTWYENDNVDYVRHVNFISDNVNNEVHLIF